jgi:site-specific DNA-methyltransferase (adenine-specific)
MDCMDYLRDCPDKSFDLAIVDPPYGININMNAGRKRDAAGAKRANKKWDAAPPQAEYFSELFRVSSYQIIWGGNYFPLPITKAWLFWDKEFPPGFSFADGELAWTSGDKALRKVAIQYNGVKGADPARIHPTQKPVKLYNWLLKHYAQPNQRILDTHLGSGSSAIAAHYFGCDFVGIELDPDYFAAAEKRFNDETRQQALL